jgi:hypothetical protein
MKHNRTQNLSWELQFLAAAKNFTFKKINFVALANVFWKCLKIICLAGLPASFVFVDSSEKGTYVDR